MVYKSLKYDLFLLCVLIRLPYISLSQSTSPLQIKKSQYADSLLKVAIEKKDTAQIAKAYYLLGKAEVAKFDFKKSNAYFLKSLKIQELRGETYESGRLNLRLYENELKQGHYAETVKYLRIAREIFERNKINKGLKECDMAMGQIFFKKLALSRN